MSVFLVEGDFVLLVASRLVTFWSDFERPCRITSIDSSSTWRHPFRVGRYHELLSHRYLILKNSTVSS